MPSIFLLQDGLKLQEMTQCPYESEDLLQKLLADFPNVLAGDQFDAEEPKRWLLIRREANVPSEETGASRWSLDHLFLDQDGIPTLVEVKRGSDTRIRREVVGQMLDYAANAIVYWPADHIREIYEKRCESAGDDPDQKLAEFLQVDLDQDEDSGAVNRFWEDVNTNLRAGRIRLIFVSDAIPKELRQIVEFLNRQMNPARVFAIEIRQFTGPGVTTLVPTVIGQTAEAEATRVRSVTRRPSQEFLDIISAYDASRGELPPTSGVAPGYRHVRIPGWPIPVKYEFMRHGKSVWVQLGAALEIYPSLAAVLSSLAGKTIGDGHATLRWAPGDGGQHKGRLVAEFPITDAPETIAQGMCDLISLTRSAVDEVLKRS